MINVVICDDDQTVITQISQYVKDYSKKTSQDVFVTSFTSGESLLFNWEDNKSTFDIIILDILMGEMNGIQTSIKLREAGFKGEIIFLTTSDEYTFDAFEVKPLNYLLKSSVTKEKFDAVFSKAVKIATKADKEMYFIQNASASYNIAIDDIIYFEVNGRVITCHTSENGNIEFYAKMDELDNHFSSFSFFRCHRSYLINLKYVAMIQNKMVCLSNKEEVPVSLHKLTELKKTLSSFLAGKES